MPGRALFLLYRSEWYRFFYFVIDVIIICAKVIFFQENLLR